MKALKRITCVLLTLSLLFGDNWITSFIGLDFTKPITATAATVTDCYEAYDGFIKLMQSTSDAASQLSLNENSDSKTRVKTAGNETSPDMSTLWKLNNYKYGIHKNYFTYEQANIDAAAQIKSGKWLNNTKYEAMTGTPTTERLFCTMGGTQWIVDLQYRMVQCKYIRRYKFNSRAANYCYYKWGPVTGGSAGQHYEVTTPSYKWNLNPDKITWHNAAFRKEEGYSLDANAWYGDQYQGGRSVTLVNGFKVPTKDNFHSGGEVFRHDAALSNSLTPNQYTVIAIKKYLFNAIKSFKDGFYAQDDNYRADQGLSDPEYDAAGNVAFYKQIGWNYTYQFMARKSYNAEGGITTVAGASKGEGYPSKNPTASAWYPCFITYLYDWQSYHESGGLNSSYPSATLAHYTYTDKSVPFVLFTQLQLRAGGLRISGNNFAYFPTELRELDIFDAFDMGAYAQYFSNIDTNLMSTYNMFFMNTGVSWSTLEDWIFFDKSKFCENATAFGYTSPCMGMKLSTDMVGDAIDQTYYGDGALEYDLVKAGFVPQATMYMYAMYYIFLNYGPLFYTSELTELFNDCPWFGTNSSWSPSKANKFLGGLFGATIVEEYNTYVSKFSTLSALIPLASFPRGGDLDGVHTFNSLSSGGRIESGAIKALEAKVLFGDTIINRTDYTYFVNISPHISPLAVYNYGDTFCTAEHGDGSHCTGCSTSGLDCLSAHVKHSPAPSGSDPHGNTYTSGCTDGTQYYTTQGHDGDGVGTCSSCAHSGSCPSSDGEDEDGNPIPHSHSSHSYHIHAASMTHHNLDTHYRGQDAVHDLGWPLQTHVYHQFYETCDVSVNVHVNQGNGNFVQSPKYMTYEDTIGQLFPNVQWLDITSYQVWMMNRGQSKGLADILASPVTVDKDSKIIQTAVVDQKGFTLYNIDDVDNKEPTDGLATITGEIKNLQARGRIANSFMNNSYGNCALSSNYVFELANPGARSHTKACTLSFLANDAPATRGQALYSRAESDSKFYSNYNYVNGDMHAFQLTSWGDSADDSLSFYYNPYSQGGRSNTSFYGFVLQALAHTLYYPADKNNKVTGNEHPTRSNSYWVSYSNSIRIQGDYIGIDYLSKQATAQQTLAGYMYDTWDEKDLGVSCSKLTHGHKFKLVKDSEEGYDAIAKYNVRCTWVPARFSYLMSRGPEDQIFGPGMQKIITCTNNCFMIHTFCKGINGDTHSCWDSIGGDSGGANCVPGSPTEMRSVTNIGNGDIKGLLSNSVPNPVRKGISQVVLKYWDNKTPYKHIKASFKSGQTYNHKYLYATINDPAPYVGYAADTSGGMNGTKDIALKGSDIYQQGYRAFVTNCKFDVSHTMVSKTPYVNEKGVEVSFARFGIKSKVEPQRINTDKNDRGTDADGANTFSSKYPWLQNLDLNRYLANDRYTTGSAQIEYESVAKHKDSGQNTIYAHTESSDAKSKDKYYYKIKKFGGGYLTADKVIYVNAAYRRTNSVAADNFEGNPNDIVVFNPVTTQSAHVVPISEYLPDATNVGAVKDKSGNIQRKYTETYLKSFLTYVKRDSRIAYKYDLDKAQGDDGTEKVVNTDSLFLAHSVTSQEYTTEEYYDVSSANTTYNVASDYEGDVSGNIRYVINNAPGNDRVEISESAVYSVQYFGDPTDNKSERSLLDLRGGDVLTFDSQKRLLMLQMAKHHSISMKSLAAACNRLKVLTTEYQGTSKLVSDYVIDHMKEYAADSGLVGSALNNLSSFAANMYSIWFDADGYLPENYSSAYADIQCAVNEADYTDKEFNASQVLNTLNKARQVTVNFANGLGLYSSTASSVTVPDMATMTINFDSSASMRKGELLLLHIKSSDKIDGTSAKWLDVSMLESDSDAADSIDIRSAFSSDGRELLIYIEASQNDATVDSVTLTAHKNIPITGLYIESLPIPVLSAYASNVNVSSVKGIDYYTIPSSYTALKNAYFVESSTKDSFEDVTPNSFILECTGFSTAGNVIKASSLDPHVVPNANWRCYVLDGWQAKGSAIISPTDDRLYNNATTLTSPNDFKISIEQLVSYANSGQLILYKTNGLYKLALASDAITWNEEYQELHIKSTFYSTEDTVEYLAFSDKDPSELIWTKEPHDLSFFTSSNIANYNVACLFYAKNVDAIAYDVKYSESEVHKYTSDSPNYYQDVFTTTTTRYMFTEEAYTKIFGSYLSLDDEFTIYWDNYADLVNNSTGDDTEGTLSNLKLTHTVLGRGWDNRKNSQSNLDTEPQELKNSSVYSNWADIKKYDYWTNMEDGALSTVTDCTKWIYTKYIIFNVDMYAFSEDKSYVYDDTKGPNDQEGKWDPTTPAFKEDGTPNHIVYIPAGSHVQLGYYKTRSSNKDRYGTNDDNGRFVDYGYRAYYNSDGSIATPDGNDKYTKDPNGDLYTYHFWIPLSDGESDNTVTVQYVVNSINSVEDYDADANKDHIITSAEYKGYPDTSDSLGNNKAKPSLSGNTYSLKQFLTNDFTGKDGHYQTDSHSSAFDRGISDEWGNKVINASGLQVLNNVSGVSGVTSKEDENGIKYFTNKTSKVYRRANNTINSSTVSVVGSIGNFAIVDVGDPRYQDTFKLSTTPDVPENYFMYPVVKAITKYSNVKGEEGSQYYYMTDYLDARGRYKLADTNLANMNGYSFAKNGGDTYSWNNAESSGSAAWYMATTDFTFATETRVPNRHSEIVNDDQSIKVGYEQICTLETIGNYFGSRSIRAGSQQEVNIDGDYGQTKLQIIPMYYAINSITGEKVNVDVYMKSGSTYLCINAGSEFANKEVADKAKEKAEAEGNVVTEAHYYEGPYYLDNAYNNAYTYGLTTNTAGEDGSTYKLDQNMLRYSITAKEAEVTYDVVKKLSQERNNVAVKNGIKTTLLDYYDYSDKSMIGGDALDCTYAYGNAQIMYLREYNRTFVGGTTAALKEQSPTTAFTKALIRNAGMYAQKWYFGIKLPSSTVFVRHGETLTYHKVTRNGNVYTLTTTDLSAEEGWTIYCRILIFSIGDKYVLISHSKPSIDPDPNSGPSTPGTDPDPKTPKPSNYLTTITINLNKQKSTVDLEGKGSH